MTIEDKQRIVFEQGSPLTGDSGERGNSTEGVESIKPTTDGERAHQTVFRRPTDNIRQRTEALRDAGEQAKYLMDQTRWVITPGRADGVSMLPLEPMAEIAWNPLSGIFTFSEAVVLQPLNTPDTDKQETVSFSFTDGIPNTANVDFTPIGGGDGDAKRAYNGANLIRVKWFAADPGDMGSAVIPGKVDITVTGDPVHVLNITIADDDTAQMSDLSNALTIVAASITSMGLTYSVGGTMSTYLEYLDITNTDFVFTGNFDREVHYIPTTTWSDFFAEPNALGDGDTLCISWQYYVEPDPGIDGRRQRIPSNITVAEPDHTTVLPSQLFITSDEPEKIPFAIPIVKRIGDDLFWIDGGVSTANANNTYPGEHGVTVDRIVDAPDDIALNITSGWYTTDPPSWAATATVNSAINGILDDLARVTTGGGAVEIGKSTYPDPGAPSGSYSFGAQWMPSAASVGEWLETLLIEVNQCARMNTGGNEDVFATWSMKNDIFWHTTPDDSTAEGVYAFLDETLVVKPATYSSEYGDGGGGAGSKSLGNVDALVSRSHGHAIYQEFGGSSKFYTSNRPLRGFYCHGGMDHQNNPGETIANQLYIGGGDAFVRGRIVHVDGFLLTDMWNGVAGKGGLTANTKTGLQAGGVNWAYRCLPMYVWLRSDGTFHIDMWGTDTRNWDNNWASPPEPAPLGIGERSNMHYKPHPDSGLVAGSWDDWDYTLVDVCWLVQGNDDAGGVAAVRFAGFLPQGGGFYALEHADYTPDNGSSFLNIYPQMMNDNQTGSDQNSWLATDNVESGTEWIRCPGIPVVSNRMHATVAAHVNMEAPSDSPDTFIGIGDVATYKYLMPNLFPSEIPSSIEGGGVTLIFKRDGYSTAQYKMLSGQVNTLREDYGAGDHWRSFCRFFLHNTAGIAPPDVHIFAQFNGFYWDKFGGCDTTDFRTIPTPPV